MKLAIRPQALNQQLTPTTNNQQPRTNNGTRPQVNQLADFLYEKVYQHPRVAQAQHEAQEQLELLFNMFTDDPGKLPARYQSRLKDQSVHSVICDYLAGMTDRYCREKYLLFR